MRLSHPPKYSKSYISTIILLLLTGLANGIILTKRKGNYKYTHYETLSKIYNTDSTLYVKELTVQKGMATITLSKKATTNRYQLWVDSRSSESITPQENSIRFQLLPAAHWYYLQPVGNSTIPINIRLDYFSNNPVGAELLYCNLPGPTTSFTPLKTWLNGVNDFTKEDLQNAKSFLRTIKGWDTCKTDYEKVLAIASFCAGICNLSNASLNPETLKALTPWQQLNKATRCQTSLNCGSYTLLFHFLATAAGIPSRGISLSGETGTGWQYGVHFFNEAFVKERNGWVLFDGLANMILPHDSSGHYFTAADIKKMLTTNTINPTIKAYFSQNGVLIERPLTDYLPHLQYYFKNNAALSFYHPGISLLKSRWQLLWEFYTFNDDVSYYNENNANNYLLIFLKMLFFFVFLLLLLRFCIQSMHVFRRQATAYPNK